MEGAYLLATLSAAMFIGSYLAGSIPLAFSFSQNRIRLFSIFGAGLLVGTALSVIIPEGVESLYGAKMEHLRKTEAGAAVLEKNVNAGGGDGPPRVIPQDAVLNQNLHVAMGNPENTNARGKRDEEMADFPAAPSQRKLLQIVPLLGNRNAPDKIAMLKLSAEHEKREGDGTGHARSANEHDHEHEHGQNVHKAIGLSLIIGFIVMLIIDQATRSATFKAGERPKFKMTATIGLVVHAAADGVAMGSASATNRTDVQFIVFLAIMLHKAPAAFGLVSFLLVEGLERFRVRRHLFVFSMAAPATALLTFYAIVAIGSESLSSGYSTGILMLFSAGTFLYVATVHVLPELVNSSAGADYQLVSQASNTSCSSPGHSHSGGGPSFTIKELGTIIIGAILPAILASGHSH